MTALEYLNTIDLFCPPDTEEDAIQQLIESHARQRLIIYRDTTEWMRSEAGQAWAEKVACLSLDECIAAIEAMEVKERTP